MVIKHLKGGAGVPSRSSSPGAAQRAARLEEATVNILGRAVDVERRQSKTVDGITDSAMRQSVKVQRSKLVG